MLVKKKANSYDDYQCEFSWVQLQAVHNALASDHADPVADEVYAALHWFFDNIPGPGESEEDLKAAEEAGASGLGAPEAGEGQPVKPGADELLPSPDGEGGAGMEQGGMEGGPGEYGPGGEGEGQPVPAGGGREEFGSQEGGGSDLDRRLPPPPRE